ncbi:NAD-dependent epimerase/dehydratase family protein [Bdellovibrionota bacterium]
MKILVTGGAGFIGSNVVDGYIREGHEVVIIDNLFTGRRENLNPKAKFYLIDIRDEEIDKIFEDEKFDIVNHHAAQMSVPASVEDPAFDADVNIKGILNLLENCVKYKIKKFIFSSTGGAIYGEKDQIPTPETETPVPLSPYAITKMASENYLKFYNHHYGLDFTVLRYGNVYGPRQVPHGEAGVVSIFFNKIVRGEIPTIYHYPEEPMGMTRDYCFVGDVVKANILALTKGSGEVINIGTGVETSTGEIYNKLLSVLRAQDYAKDPSFEKPPKGPSRHGDLRRSALHIEKAKNALGWSPDFTVDKGLLETVKFELPKKPNKQ